MWPASVCGQPAWVAATQPGPRRPARTAGVTQPGGLGRPNQCGSPSPSVLPVPGNPGRPGWPAPPNQGGRAAQPVCLGHPASSRQAYGRLAGHPGPPGQPGRHCCARRLPPAEARCHGRRRLGAQRAARSQRSPRSRGLAADEGHRGDCRCCSCRRLDCKSHQVGRAQHPRPPARATAPAHPRQPCGRPDDHPPCSASRYRLPTLGDAPRRPDLAEAVRGGATVPTGRRAQRSRRASRIRHRGKRPGGWAALPLAAAGSARLSRRRAAFQSAPKAARLGRGGVAGRPRQGSPPPGRPPSVPRQSTCSSRGRLPAVAAESSLLS